MDAAAFQSQLEFYMPPCGVCNMETLRFTPEMLKIFYIARVLFSETSTHRIKAQTAPLLNREEIFTSHTVTSPIDTEATNPSLMDNFINLTKMTALRDIARLLPREYFLYSDLIFYKKLANRELIKIDYESPSGGVTSVDSFLKHHETELKRSQKVYLLFDNSTSMNGEKFKKLFVAKAIAIEYLRRVCLEHPQIYFRSFHTDVGNLVKAATEESIYKLINHISQIQTGGGRITNIGDAIVQAIEDITSDRELEQAEIMVLTDGFGPIPTDLRQQLGEIKLHIVLIPDLDIEKILVIYPTRQEWERGGPSGTRPMPDFWQYYSKTPPPMFLEGEEMYKDTMRSYQLASKSIADQKGLEILQGLNQIYKLHAVCKEFIFVLITSILNESFQFSVTDLESMEAHIREMNGKDISIMNNEQKLQFLQAVNFLLQFLMMARSNAKDKATKQKIGELRIFLEAIQSRIMQDPWIRTMLQADDIKINFKFDLGAARKEDQMPMLEAFGWLMRFFWQTIADSFRRIWHEYKM